MKEGWRRGAAVAWLVAVGFAGIGTAFAKEPRNLDLAKREIRAYASSGEYQRDVSRVAEEAE